MFFRGKKEEEIDKLDEEAPKKTRRKKEADDLVWDKKRVIVSIIIVVLVLFGAKMLKSTFFPNVNILGESTVKKASEIEKPNVENPNIDLQTQVGKTLDQIKDNVIELDPEEVASSSPQIQKVLNDIQNIKNLPADQARNACMKICSGI